MGERETEGGGKERNREIERWPTTYRLLAGWTRRTNRHTDGRWESGREREREREREKKRGEDEMQEGREVRRIPDEERGRWTDKPTTKVTQTDANIIWVLHVPEQIHSIGKTKDKVDLPAVIGSVCLPPDRTIGGGAGNAQLP